jgi:hypothetical protein
MNITEQTQIAKMAAEIAALRAENASLQTLCERLTCLGGKQQQEIAALTADRADVPKLGILDASKRIPRP